MARVLFALFDAAGDAGAAVETLGRSEILRARSTVAVHRGHVDVNAELPLFETAAAQTMARAAIGGLLVGLALGVALFGPTGLLVEGALGPLVASTGLGGACGMLFGYIAGSAAPEKTIANLTRAVENGRVLVVVETSTRAAADEAEWLLAEHGAHLVHRRLLRQDLEIAEALAAVA